MIEPTVGRMVHFTPAKASTILRHEQPLAAIVTYVWNPRMVNLTVFDPNGASHACTSVTLLQDDDVPNEAGYYAQWMPFQKGQAAKTEALEAKISGAAQ